MKLNTHSIIIIQKYAHLEHRQWSHCVGGSQQGSCQNLCPHQSKPSGGLLPSCSIAGSRHTQTQTFNSHVLLSIPIVSWLPLTSTSLYTSTSPENFALSLSTSFVPRQLSTLRLERNWTKFLRASEICGLRRLFES